MTDFDFLKDYHWYYKNLLSKTLTITPPAGLDVSDEDSKIIGDMIRNIKNTDYLATIQKAALGYDASLYAGYLIALSDFARGNISNVVFYINENISNDRIRSYCLYIEGIISLKNENYTEASRSFLESIALNSKNNASCAPLAFLYCCAERYQDSLKYAEAALQGGQEEYAGRILKIIYSISSFYCNKGSWINYNLSTFWEPLRQAEIESIPNMAFDQKYAPSTQPIIFTSCDSIYLKEHAAALYLSFLETGSKAAFHFHIINPSNESADIIDKLRSKSDGVEIYLSYEHVDLSDFDRATYLSSIRFVRFYQLLTLTTRRIIMLDADMLLREKLEDMMINSCIAALISNKEISPPWERVAAGIISIKSSEESLEFISAVASVIIRNICEKKNVWFIDQIALSCAYSLLNNEVVERLDGAVFSDQQFTLKSKIWAVVNEEKYTNSIYNYYKRYLLNKYSVLTYDAACNEVVVADGKIMLINKNDEYIGKSLKQSGQWCRHETDIQRKLIKEGGWVVEAGSNIGSHSVLLSRHVGPNGRIYCFEPQRLVFQILAANIALNSCINAFCYQSGIGAASGTARVLSYLPDLKTNFGDFSISRKSAERILDYNFMECYYETITIVTIDSLKLERCDLIKADVEGMERDVIMGATNTIDNFRPIIYAEHHDNPESKDILSLLGGLDYCVYSHGTKNDPNIVCFPVEKQHYEKIIVDDPFTIKKLV